MTDDELLAELRANSRSALELLISRYHKPIYAYLYRMLNNKHQAEDLTQECFLRVLAMIRKNRLPDSLRSWLYTIAHNLCRDFWRRSSTKSEVLQDLYAQDYSADDNQTVAFIFDRQEERERVIRAVGMLGPEKRNLIILRFYQELKLDEIAGVLELPLGTVKSRLYQSLAELHRILRNMEPDWTEKQPATLYSGKR